LVKIDKKNKTTCLLARGWARWAMAGVAEVKMKLEDRAAAHAAALEEHQMMIKKISVASKSLMPKPPASALAALKTLANNRGLQLRCEDERVREQEWRARYALTTSEGERQLCRNLLLRSLLR
jgi:hypothetical protein